MKPKFPLSGYCAWGFLIGAGAVFCLDLYSICETSAQEMGVFLLLITLIWTAIIRLSNYQRNVGVR